jgi:hypothetical protein
VYSEVAIQRTVGKYIFFGFGFPRLMAICGSGRRRVRRLRRRFGVANPSYMKIVKSGCIPKTPPACFLYSEMIIQRTVGIYIFFGFGFPRLMAICGSGRRRVRRLRRRFGVANPSYIAALVGQIQKQVWYDEILIITQ